jgi:2-C-methyl-D-erythritol 4-phosphate cytidylyltransferase
MKISVLLVAAGSGERLGQGPKALIELGGKTFLERALESFAWADELVVALPPNVLLPELPKVRYVTGGSTRQQSVYSALEVATGDLVLVHDVARVFVVQAAVKRLINQTRRSGAATLVVSVPDTLVQHNTGEYGPVIPREQYRLVQTPQGFKRELLLKAHRAAQQTGREFSDDAQVVLALGHPVELVEGDRRMFKITYPEDLEIARGLVEVWRG